jgi:hypothetical protein
MSQRIFDAPTLADAELAERFVIRDNADRLYTAQERKQISNLAREIYRVRKAGIAQPYPAEYGHDQQLIHGPQSAALRVPPT